MYVSNERDWWMLCLSLIKRILSISDHRFVLEVTRRTRPILDWKIDTSKKTKRATENLCAYLALPAFLWYVPVFHQESAHSKWAFEHVNVDFSSSSPINWPFLLNYIFFLAKKLQTIWSIKFVKRHGFVNCSLKDLFQEKIYDFLDILHVHI